MGALPLLRQTRRGRTTRTLLPESAERTSGAITRLAGADEKEKDLQFFVINVLLGVKISLKNKIKKKESCNYEMYLIAKPREK